MTQPSLPSSVIATGPGFWNLRGSFKLGGVLDIGTHSSLVRRQNGKFVLLDACGLTDEQQRWVDAETDGGRAIEAILHLHPFHTMWVKAAHQRYPHARLYGTGRHHRLGDGMPWQRETTDSEALHALFADDLTFSVPRGVELIPANESLHFSSVLAFHPASRTLHVDDTVTYVRLPKLLRALKPDVMSLHPTLAQVLERRAGAASEFRQWGLDLVKQCAGVDHLCAAHGAVLSSESGEVARRVEQAIAKVDGKLKTHERKYG